MSLLKIEKDEGLVGLRYQCGQNEGVIWNGGGFGVTSFPPWSDMCRAPNATPLGHSTPKHTRYVVVWLVMRMVPVYVTWSRRVGSKPPPPKPGPLASLDPPRYIGSTSPPSFSIFSKDIKIKTKTIL